MSPLNNNTYKYDCTRIELSDGDESDLTLIHRSFTNRILNFTFRVLDDIDKVFRDGSKTVICQLIRPQISFVTSFKW